MIANDREFAVTKKALARFEVALAIVDEQNRDLHPMLRQALREDIEGQIEELRAQLAEYERTLASQQSA